MSKLIGRQATAAQNSGKITFKISTNDFIVSIICLCLSRAKLLTYMNPFGMAAYAALFSNTGWFYALLCTASGIIISKGDYTSLRYILALGVATPILGLSDRRSRTLFKATVMSVSYFAVSLCLLVTEGFLVYDFIYFSFESFICFVCICLIDDVAPVLANYSSRTRLSVREITSLACMAALVVLSCASLPSFFGMNLSSVLSVFIILAVNLKGDCMMGAAVGVIMGVVVSMGSYESASVVGAYAFTSFLSGMFKKYSRLGVLLGFTLANAIVTAFLNDTGQILINPIEVLIAGFVFVTMPKKALRFFTDFAQKASGVYADSGTASVVSSDSAISGVYRQCGDLANSLHNLSVVYAEDCKPKRPGKRYINELFNKCADSVCSGCGLRFGCWQSVTHNNYQYMLAMFEQANKNGAIDMSHVPKKFADRCIKKEEFVRAFNFVYKIYQSDKLWLEKTYRLQKLMSEQLDAVYSSLQKIQSNSLLVCNMEMSAELACELDKYKCEPCNVAVLQSGDEIKRVSVDFHPDKYPEGYSDSMAAIVSHTLDMPFAYNGESMWGEDKKSMLFIPRKAYSVRSAHLQMQKSGEYVCGDCVAEFSKSDGNYMAVISDGMGSGNAAHSESKATVAMLVNLVDAGASVDTAVELINSALVVRSQKDCFSTIDILDTDLDSGKITVSKIGAAPTYIIKDGLVKKLECSSLPAGILTDIQAQNYIIDADDKTVVVMMSDGISNTTLKNVYEQDWISGELQSLAACNPDVISKHIMNSAIKRYGGKCADDMTIAVAIIYRNE